MRDRTTLISSLWRARYLAAAVVMMGCDNATLPVTPDCVPDVTCGDCATCSTLPHVADATCSNSVCRVITCESGFADCDGMATSGCEASLSDDESNCGRCGLACPTVGPDSYLCVQGRCEAQCHAGFRDCDGDPANGCEVNLKSDPAACGECGHACPGAGMGQVARCTNGQCGLQCMPGFGDCNASAADGCEHALAADPEHCGACGNVCSRELPICRAGRCVENDRVLVVFSSAYQDDVRKTLVATGAFSLVDEWDASKSTPALHDLQKYRTVLAYGDNHLIDAKALGDVLADYFDDGGSVVVAPFLNATQILGGRFGDARNGYILISPGQQEEPFDRFGLFREPGTPLVANITAISAMKAFRSSGMVINNGKVVAEWALGRPMLVRGTVKGRNIVALNVFPPSVAARSDFVAGDVGVLLRNVLLYR